jgi:hypothetical protein
MLAKDEQRVWLQEEGQVADCAEGCPQGERPSPRCANPRNEMDGYLSKGGSDRIDAAQSRPRAVDVDAIFVPAELNVSAFERTRSSRRAKAVSNTSGVCIQGRNVEASSRGGPANRWLNASIKVGENAFAASLESMLGSRIFFTGWSCNVWFVRSTRPFA